MGQVNGVFLYDGNPTDGATAKLWPSSEFVSPPEYDDDEPASGQVGATLTTGTTYGGTGMYRWTSVDDGEYYVSVEYLNHRSWQYHKVEAIAELLTTQGDTLFKGASVLERRGIGSEGQVYKVVSGEPAWVTEGWIALTSLYKNSNDTERSTASATYVKLKEMKLNNGFVGSIRIHFDMRADAAVNGWGRIYRNGVALGTERTNGTGAYITYSESFSDVTWSSDDLLQIYVKVTLGWNGLARNFRLGYEVDKAAESVTNQDP